MTEHIKINALQTSFISWKILRTFTILLRINMRLKEFNRCTD